MGGEGEGDVKFIQDVLAEQDPEDLVAEEQLRKNNEVVEQVLGKDESLTGRPLRRCKVLNEIIETERDYIKDLAEFLKIRRQLLRGKILSQAQAQLVFSNVGIIFGLNQELLNELVNDYKTSR